jgi:hypothetical protein
MKINPRPWLGKGFRYRSVGRALLHASPLLALTILGCGAVASPQAGGQATPISQTVSTPIPTPTPLPTPQGFPIGTNIPTKAGDAFQVIAYLDHVASNNPFNVAPAGGFFAAANVKECASTANSASPPITANPFSWRHVGCFASLGLRRRSAQRPRVAVAVHAAHPGAMHIRLDCIFCAGRREAGTASTLQLRLFLAPILLSQVASEFRIGHCR